MSLVRLLRALRRQPRHVRDNVAFGAAAAITAVAAVLWVYQTSNPLTAGDLAADNTSEPRMFAGLRDSLSEQTAAIGDAIAALRGDGVSAGATTTEAATSSTTPATNTINYKLTEENRRYLTSSSSATTSPHISQPAEVDQRRVVLIATTSASSSADMQ